MTHHNSGADFGAFFDALGLPVGMFLVGLFGGFTHCSMMCGPFVLAQVTARLEGSASFGGELARLAGAALVPYHLGRMTSYVALGALAGALTGGAAALPGFSWFTALMLAVAATVFTAQALTGLRRFVPGNGALGRWLARQANPLLRDPRGLRGYGLGLALGLLPCGLLYGAIAAAAGAGGMLGGALAMAGFALGTVPGLVGVGWVGAFFGRRWRGALRVAATPVMLFNAAVLLMLSWRALG